MSERNFRPTRFIPAKAETISAKPFCQCGKRYSGKRKRFCRCGKPFCGRRKQLCRCGKPFCNRRKQLCRCGKPFCSRRKQLCRCGKRFSGMRKRYSGMRKSFCGCGKRYSGMRKPFCGCGTLLWYIDGGGCLSGYFSRLNTDNIGDFPEMIVVIVLVGRRNVTSNLGDGGIFGLYIKTGFGATFEVNGCADIGD